METRARSYYPDSPHPGHGHPSDWIAKPYSIVFTGVGLFILIFGIAIFLGYRQFEPTRQNALTADKTTANLLADLILEHNKATIGILQSYAHRPLFIAAVKNKNRAGAYRHLSDLKKNAEIDLTFVTDKRGIVWANFPVFPEGIGKNLSNRDWYKGISSHWKPYISTIFKLIVGDKPLAVAVCVPIFDEKERVIGILASSQRLGFLVDAIQKVPFSPYTTVNVIDRTGQILYSNKFSYQESITDYRFFPIIESALKEIKQQIEMNDPQKDHEKSYLTVVPVGDIGWSVIIERSLKDIYRSEFRRFIEIGTISFLLFLLITVALVYLRKSSLFRKTEELLQADIKLRQSEEELQWLFKSMINAFVLFESVFDDDGHFIGCRFVYINDAYERIIGVKNKEVKGKTIHEVWPETEPEWIKRYGDVAVTGASQTFELYHDPTKKLYNCNVYRPWDTKDRFCVILEDITERKRAEETLRRSEENFRNSLDDSPMGVRIVTEEGKTIYANRAILDIYGYDSMEDLKTTPVEKRYTPESHADFLIRREKRQQGVDVPSEYTINIIRKDGEVRHLLVLRREILWDGERQFQVLYNDITERKRAEVALRESEGRLRTIIEASLDAIVAVNVEGRLVLFNGAAQELFQYSEKEALNQPADILLREEICKIHQERLEKFLNTGVGRCGHIGRRMEKFFRRKDGSLFEAEVSMSGGRFDGLRLVVLAIHDITSRKKTEETLRESEFRYRELFDNISSGVAIYEVTNNGNDFIFKDFNRAGERLDGDRKEDIIGKSIYQVRPGINEYGLLEVFKRVWATGIPEHYPAKFYQDEQLQGWYDNFVYRLPSGEIVAVYDDITDRKQAEEELRESEEKYRNILENIEDGYFEVDLAGNFTFFNPSLCRVLGYPREEMPGMNNRVFMDAENAKKVFRAFNEVYVTGIPTKGFEWETIRKDGARVYIEVSVSLIARPGEKPTGFRGIARDITDRKRAEEAPHRAEENFHRSLDNSPLGVRIVTIEGETIYANRAILDFYGDDSIEELRTTPLKERYTPESYAEFLIRKGKRKRRGDGPSEYGISIVRKDGEVRHLQVFRKEILWNGEEQFQVIYQDITERKLAEQAQVRLVAMLDATPGFVGFADAKDTHVLYINPAGRKMVGVQAQEDVTQLKIADVHPEWTNKLFRDEIIPTAIRDGLWTGECAFLNRDGHEIPVMMALLAHKSPSGEVERFSTISIDITERKQAEEALRASREQMRALAGRLQAVREEERTRIAREIHDELGGALTGLKIDFSLLTRAALKIENQTVRTSLLAGMDSMIKFIDATIHTVRRIAMELRPGVLDDLGLVAALEWQLKDFEKRTGIRCEFFPPVEDISLDADLSTALFRIFQEALTNVARHSGATEVRVRLRADADSSTLEVEDNGKGIGKKKILSSKSLGLLGMRERAQMFGGRITVTGTPGIGTKVMVEIPPVEKRKMDRDQEGAAG